MKKIIFALTCIFTLQFSANAYAKEVQISNYRYTKCVHLMDGYTYCMNGERGEILKPSGHKAYSMSEYTAPYSMGYSDYGLNHENLLPISYPQGEIGTVFIIYSPEKNAMGLMNQSSQIIAPVEYDVIRLMGPNYFWFSKGDKCGILSALDGHVVGETEMSVYIGDDMSHYAFADIFTENGMEYANAEFYNENGYKIQKLEAELLSTSPRYDSENKAFIDSYGNTYRKVNLGNGFKYVELPQDDITFNPWEFNGYDAVKPSITGEIKSDRVDNKYYFKEKKIGDKTYYAVFADVVKSPEGYSKVGYGEDDTYSTMSYNVNTECIPWIYKDNSRDTFISISQYCRYTDSISKLDFCILLLNTYMYDKGLDIADYAESVDISDIYFNDTDDVYIRLAVKLGLIDAENNSEFKPYDKLTRAEAAVCFDRLSKLMENKGSVLGRRFSDMGGCSHEQKRALTSLSKLKNARFGYVIMTEDGKFYPDKNISTEDAYAIAYRLATYNKSGGHEYMDWVEFMGWSALCAAGVVYLVYKRKKRKKAKVA